MADTQAEPPEEHEDRPATELDIARQQVRDLSEQNGELTRSLESLHSRHAELQEDYRGLESNHAMDMEAMHTMEKEYQQKIANMDSRHNLFLRVVANSQQALALAVEAMHTENHG